MPSPTVPATLVSSVPDRAVVERLQWHRSDPSVSVLLTTTVGPALATHDVVRLHRLLDLADRRVAAEAGPEAAGKITPVLRELAVAARRVPARRGLALFASGRHAEAVQLPAMVTERVVVDPTFATRDLLSSLHATPRFRVLVLALRSSRLFEGTVHQLCEITTHGFPVRGLRDRRDRAARFGRDRSDERDNSVVAHIRAVDAAVASVHAREPLPLLITGVSRQLAMFRSHATTAPAVVGEIAGNHERTSPTDLAALAAPVIDGHLARRSDAAVARLEAGRRRGRMVTGIDAVWAAASRGRVGLLCVEEGFSLPASVTGNGSRLRPAASPEGAGVLDDSIDELIEQVSMGGAEVTVLEDGRLAAHARVAALVS